MIASAGSFVRRSVTELYADFLRRRLGREQRRQWNQDCLLRATQANDLLYRGLPVSLPRCNTSTSSIVSSIASMLGYLYLLWLRIPWYALASFDT